MTSSGAGLANIEGSASSETISKHLPDTRPSSEGDAGPPSDDRSSVQILDWDGPDDPENPYNWPIRKKWLVTGTALIGTFIVPINGTAMTLYATPINEMFGISDAHFSNSYWPVTSWSTGGGIFVIIFLPLMEDLGVRKGYFIFYIFFILMIIPQALAQNFATLIVTRFFSGGCVALLANTISSMIPDIWEGDEARSGPIALYIFMYLTGSTIGPPIFAGLRQNVANWRWIFYIQLIIYVAFFPLALIFLKETRGNVILRRRAKRLRAETNKPIFTAAELSAPPLARRLLRSVTRPMYLLFTEPVLFAITLWSAFCFGTVFLFTQSIAYVFTELRNWNEAQIGYIQGAVVIGEIFGYLATLYSARLHLRSAAHNTETPGSPIPEARLYVSIAASFFGIVGGMFVYAWTAYPQFPSVAPAVGLTMVGFGIQVVVSSATDYITDSYAPSGYAGSAVSAVAAGENIVAAFLPLAALKMYSTLEIHWASTLLGFLALLLSFAPVLFVWKGSWFRKRSPFMLTGGQTPPDAKEKKSNSQNPMYINHDG